MKKYLVTEIVSTVDQIKNGTAPKSYIIDESALNMIKEKSTENVVKDEVVELELK